MGPQIPRVRQRAHCSGTILDKAIRQDIEIVVAQSARARDGIEHPGRDLLQVCRWRVHERAAPGRTCCAPVHLVKANRTPGPRMPSVDDGNLIADDDTMSLVPRGCTTNTIPPRARYVLASRVHPCSDLTSFVFGLMGATPGSQMAINFAMQTPFA